MPPSLPRHRPPAAGLPPPCPSRRRCGNKPPDRQLSQPKTGGSAGQNYSVDPRGGQFTARHPRPRARHAARGGARLPRPNRRGESRRGGHRPGPARDGQPRPPAVPRPAGRPTGQSHSGLSG
ncbi:hypothetical protein D3877_00915 [Azospirillum cavernae]|uniref:Uncharacterized protein n=1 Tax=Azospirillum cavernae TaxID=2320860 RepID=A0A418VZU1_9PROT|nr:hypothetical protein D3877_00915 [Azospirillum cavernae]